MDQRSSANLSACTNRTNAQRGNGGMLIVQYDENDCPVYTVLNGVGAIVIRTRNEFVAKYINACSKGAPADAQIGLTSDRKIKGTIWKKPKTY